jgi:hypothetical protein
MPHGVSGVSKGEASMKKPLHAMIVMTIMAIFAGCGSTTKEIARMSQSEKTGVFAEVTSEGPAPAGYADLVIKASLKTPLPGHYTFERSARGKAIYAFLINIDGQAVLWQEQGQKHLLPEYVNGKTSRDPEAGKGMKYVLEKRVRLAVGSHNVFFGLPDEPNYATTNISVKSGERYVLEFKPNYRYKIMPTRIPTYFKGVSKFEVMFQEIVV